MTSSGRIFEHLRAEYETQWLSDIFVEPDNYPALLSYRSTLLFGAPGSGRTALCKQLLHLSNADPNGPLVVEWQPSLMGAGRGKADLYFATMNLIYDQIARALLQQIPRRPSAFLAAPDWVQETAAWFAQTHLTGNRRRFGARLEETLDSEGIDVLRRLLNDDFEPALTPESPDRMVIAELADLVQRLGWSGLWLLVDGLESWLTSEVQEQVDGLDNLLSTLELFEIPRFSIKIFSPSSLELMLMSCGGVLRDRLRVLRLAWRQEQLQQIAAKRVALATGQKAVLLSDLYTQELILERLVEQGGGTPRGWLSLLRPVVDIYLGKGNRTLSEKEWESTQRGSIPPLRMDLRQQRVYVGFRQIENVQPSAYELLSYLYQHPERKCSAKELYYRAYRKLEKIPATENDSGWQPPSSWRSWYDTTLSRLRQAIEPNHRKPVYVVTVRGKGVELRNAL
ncbi:MAG: hypothetical protein KJZ86_00625 [Caldilineaceae bacterium]|nr:hypothetical protein [Caldilineaceae bacterium]HRJ40288.1 hypothetical protein [Caldilineaceae bacterium]